jgi:hypothetical protein
MSVLAGRRTRAAQAEKRRALQFTIDRFCTERLR